MLAIWVALSQVSSYDARDLKIYVGSRGDLKIPVESHAKIELEMGGRGQWHTKWRRGEKWWYVGDQGSKVLAKNFGWVKFLEFPYGKPNTGPKMIGYYWCQPTTN
jgi:hypothetical protein